MEGHFKALRAVFTEVNGVALLFKRALDEAADLGFIFNDKNAHGSLRKALQLRSQLLKLLTYSTAYAPGSSFPAASLEGFLISLYGNIYQPITEIEKLAALSQGEKLLP